MSFAYLYYPVISACKSGVKVEGIGRFTGNDGKATAGLSGRVRLL